MRTTKRQLLEMLEVVNDDAEIILKVRGNSTLDYYERQEIAVKKSGYNNVVYIIDELSN